MYIVIQKMGKKYYANVVWDDICIKLFDRSTDTMCGKISSKGSTQYVDNLCLMCKLAM